jgi:hypothetical protein
MGNQKNNSHPTTAHSKKPEKKVWRPKKQEIEGAEEDDILPAKVSCNTSI